MNDIFYAMKSLSWIREDIGQNLSNGMCSPFYRDEKHHLEAAEVSLHLHAPFL
jgi:hypothetical protein